jgi:exodeoxyribonuclease V alpha subunit
VVERICIVTGSPGTGKTLLVKAMVQIMRENAISFELLTPTGIAAKRLGTTAGCEAYTIHRRLGYKGMQWDYNALNKYSTQVVIIDEVSMVDQEVCYRLLSALYSSTRLVFVGDVDQLPSVGPGNVLRELIESKLIKTIFLHTIFRQEECSDIIKAAKKIKEGDTDLSLFSEDKKRDIWFIREKSPDAIEQTIIKFSAQLKEGAKTKGNKLAFQIITPRNEGPCSVATLNVALQGALNPPDKDKKEVTINNSIIRKGDRVIIRKNNYEIGVFNGDIGKVVFITMANITIDLEDFYGESRRIDIPLKIADEMIKLAYSITVHRAQGAEYPIVIIPFIKAHGALLLQRNLLYTAITRAKKKVIIIGQASAIESAIKNDKIQRRNTRFSERIKEWMQGSGQSIRGMFSNPSTYKNSAVLERLLSLEEKSQ